jgi:hypothetical protein
MAETNTAPDLDQQIMKIKASIEHYQQRLLTVHPAERSIVSMILRCLKYDLQVALDEQRNLTSNKS